MTGGLFKGADCICISKVTKFKANNNWINSITYMYNTVFA